MTRILEKSDFISLLKEVSNTLNKENIKNEIPFVYKNKKEYEFIKILIPYDTDATILEKIFNSNQYNLKGRFIDFYYKDFRFVFIRTPDNEFFQSFYYYSWDILPTLMNVILNKMGLHLFSDGLKYVAGKNSFLISNNIKYIIEFLDLDFDHYIKRGFNTIFDEVSYVTLSSYFNTNIFKEYKINENDFFYFEKKPLFDQALKLFNSFDSINFNGYNFDNNLDTFLLNIDTMFPGSNFLENVIKNKN